MTIKVKVTPYGRDLAYNKQQYVTREQFNKLSESHDRLIVAFYEKDKALREMTAERDAAEQKWERTRANSLNWEAMVKATDDALRTAEAALSARDEALRVAKVMSRSAGLEMPRVLRKTP